MINGNFVKRLRKERPWKLYNYEGIFADLEFLFNNKSSGAPGSDG